MASVNFSPTTGGTWTPMAVTAVVGLWECRPGVVPPPLSAANTTPRVAPSRKRTTATHTHRVRRRRGGPGAAGAGTGVGSCAVRFADGMTSVAPAAAAVAANGGAADAPWGPVG